MAGMESVESEGRLMMRTDYSEAEVVKFKLVSVPQSEALLYLVFNYPALLKPTSRKAYCCQNVGILKGI